MNSDSSLGPALLDPVSASPQCPSSDQLQQLLDGTLPPGDFPTLEKHVQTCMACQQALDKLTDDSGNAWVPTRDAARAAVRLPTIPRHELLEELGRGGYGVVYRGRDAALDRQVAIKVLKHGILADSADRQRFLTEARAAARLTHPNIVPVFEVGDADGVSYIVMEYAAGGTLSKLLDGTPLSDRTAAELVETLARAVDYAHSLGVLHRDLKPGNILLANDQCPITSDQHGTNRSLVIGHWSCQPKVADFGTARLLDVPGDLTPTQAILGTPSYMAPEQAGGQSRQVGPAADVYSLGAILYELLTGRPPFRAATPFETLLLVREQEPVSVRRLNPTVPRDLDTIALKCLEKDPAKRYPTAGAMGDDLRRWLDVRSILARPIGVVGKATRWANRHPAAFLLTSALVLMAVGSLVTVTVLWRRSVEHGELAERRRDDIQAREQLLMEALVEFLVVIGDMRGKPGELSARERQAIGKILALHERLIAEGRNDSAARWKMVRASAVIANIYWYLGDGGQAIRIHLRAGELLEGLAAEFPDDPTCQFEMARHLNGVGDERALRRSIDLLAGIRQTDTVRRDWAVLHANNLTLLAQRLGNFPEEADRLLAEAEAVCRDLMATKPNDHDVRQIEIQIRISRGTNAARLRGDLRAGYEANVAGIELFKDLRKVREDNSDGLDSLGSRFTRAADFAWRLGDRSAAIEYLRDGTLRLEEASNRFPKFSSLRHLYFQTAWQLGDALWQTDRPQAEAAYANARRAADQLVEMPNLLSYVLCDIEVFFNLCPIERLRDRDRKLTEHLTFVKNSRMYLQLRLGAGQLNEAQEAIKKWRAEAPADMDPGERNIVDLVEVLLVYKQGDPAAARKLYEVARKYTGHAWERAVEHDRLRQEVEEMLAAAGKP